MFAPFRAPVAQKTSQRALYAALRMQDILIVQGGDGQKGEKASAFSPSNHRLSRVRAPQEFARIGSGGATVFEGHVAIAHDPAITGRPLH
jgi:hypothetical protein